MDRAGRKSLMFRSLTRHDSLFPRGCLTTAKLAHKAGMRASSHVVKMLKEMEKDGLIREVKIEPHYACSYLVRAWQLVKMETVPLPDAHIIINGKNYRRDSGEEVTYVRL
jgi:hypothetical protein